MEKAKEWFDSLEDQAEISIFKREYLKTVLIYTGNTDRYEFASQSDELRLLFDVEHDLSQVDFYIISYLWSGILYQESEAIENVYVDGDNSLVVEADNNTYYLKK